MKNKSIFFIVFWALSSINAYSQETPTKLQFENQSSNHYESLTAREADLLDSLLVDSRKDFSFHNKKIAFITGSGASKIISKTEYFNTCINPWLEKNNRPQIVLILLTKKEKVRSGGYDALVLSWVKVLSNKQKERIIEKLENS